MNCQIRNCKVTVITVCYNCEKEIENTIQSVLNQLYTNVEYIIQDGLSTDNTLKIIEKYKEQIIVYSENDYGVFDAMNRALKHVTGDWVIFMNAGDMFYNEYVLSELFDSSIYNSDVGVIYGDVFYARKNKMKYVQSSPFFTKEGIRAMGICHQSMFFRADIVKKIGFDLLYKYAADYNLAMLLFRNGWRFIYYPHPIAIYDLTGISTNNQIEQYKEVAKICGVVSGFSYYLGLIKALKRKTRIKLKQLINIIQ